VDAVAPESGTVGPMDAGELRRWSDTLATRAPAEVLAAAAQRWPAIRFGTGFGPEGCALVDMIARHRLPVDMFTLDTGLLFPETYALWHRLQERYGVVIRALRPALTVAQQAAVFGERLWERDPDRCCALRKVEPLRAALRGAQAWVTSIRRDQTADRSTAHVLEWDERFALVKVNPLAHWTSADVRAYVRAHDVPTNPLHERGYPSIGCLPCTTPVAAGESDRAGRWRGKEKTECGLHNRSEVAPVYPAFLKLAGRPVVVVGGGKTAAAKLPALAEAGAVVTVVAPEVRPEIEVAGVTVIRRAFAAADLDAAWFVIAAATPEVNEQVARAAEGRRVFVNAVDDPRRASAYLGGVVRRDGVTFAISTDGQAPALAGLLREGLDAVLPRELATWVAEARRLKTGWRADPVPMAERRPALLRALVKLYPADAR